MIIIIEYIYLIASRQITLETVKQIDTNSAN